MEFAPVVVSRHEGPGGRWEIASREPHPVLRQYVRRIMGYIEYTAPGVRKEYPSTDIVLIVTLGSPLTIHYPSHPGGSLVVKQGFAGGLIDAPIDTQASGLAMGLQVNFTTIGARLFYGIPLHELVNRSVELEDVLGSEGRTLTDRLNDTPGWDARFAILESAILARFERAAMPSRGVDWAVHQLQASGGMHGIGELGESLGWSPRRLIDEFRDCAGMPPKAVARIIRFERTLARMQQSPEARLVDIAVEGGYYDQAHFNREFRALSGMTPSQLRAELERTGVPEF